MASFISNVHVDELVLLFSSLDGGIIQGLPCHQSVGETLDEWVQALASPIT